MRRDRWSRDATTGRLYVKHFDVGRGICHAEHAFRPLAERQLLKTGSPRATSHSRRQRGQQALCLVAIAQRLANEHFQQSHASPMAGTTGARR